MKAFILLSQLFGVFCIQRKLLDKQAALEQWKKDVFIIGLSLGIVFTLLLLVVISAFVSSVINHFLTRYSRVRSRSATSDENPNLADIVGNIRGDMVTEVVENHSTHVAAVTTSKRRSSILASDCKSRISDAGVTETDMLGRLSLPHQT